MPKLLKCMAFNELKKWEKLQVISMIVSMTAAISNMRAGSCIFLNRSLAGADISTAANDMIFLASTNLLCIHTGRIQLPLPVQTMSWNLMKGLKELHAQDHTS